MKLICLQENLVITLRIRAFTYLVVLMPPELRLPASIAIALMFSPAART